MGLAQSIALETTSTKISKGLYIKGRISMTNHKDTSQTGQEVDRHYLHPGELYIKDFECSRHGKITPKPVCPKCEKDTLAAPKPKPKGKDWINNEMYLQLP